jgi:mannose/fructose/N-acetylgalactosamine-specific phosphotransferase system component IIB
MIIIGEYIMRLLFEKGSMNNYLTNYYIFIKVFENKTKKNLMVLVRKVTDIYNYYTPKNSINSINYGYDKKD